MNNIQYFLRKHSPLIMTVVASGGVIFTTILAVKATPKAIKKIEEAEKNKGEKLTICEKIKYGWEPFLYCGISGLSTIACIASIQYLNYKKQASIISAYTLLENAYNQYRHNIIDLYSKDADFIARQEIVKAKYDPEYETFGEEVLFFDYQGMRFFKSTMDNVVVAENRLLESLKTRGYACLNEYYDYLGIPFVDYGYQLGWSNMCTDDPRNIQQLEFNYEKTIVGDSLECWIITCNIPAAFDYIL